MPGKTITRTCDYCGRSFRPTPYQLRNGWGRFCSQKCGRTSRPIAPAEERFWKHIVVSDGCWLWTAALNEHGYGVINAGAGKGNTLAHRFSWELNVGPVLDGMCVLHNCPSGDNPACVNPAHLWLGTRIENMADMAAKGRWNINGLRELPKGEANPNSKLDADRVRTIRSRHAQGCAIRALAREFGVDPSTVRSVVRGETWIHIV